MKKTSMTVCNPNLIIIAIVASIMSIAAAGTIAPSAGAVRHQFSAKLLNTIALVRTQENVVFSPASIHTCLGLGFLGAKGKTADELRQGLILGGAQETDIARNYGDFIKSSFRSVSDGPQLTMANRIYVNDKLHLAPEFNKNAEKYFNAKAEPVAFSDSASAIEKINNWVEDQTNHKIKNLMQKDAVDGDTSAVIVNAIYFKGLWEKQFSKISTHKSSFTSSNNRKVDVEMMFNDDLFKYAELRDFDATAIELPYENSNLSMLIILPNANDGLKQLETKLAAVDLSEVAYQLKMEDVDLLLPKFEIEFDIDLKEPLKQMGMSNMFSDRADFSGLFKTDVSQKISDVMHKAYLKVNEAGSEAAAATFMKIVPMSLNFNKKNFTADHPFFFAIRDSNAVYFTGHVAQL